MSEKITEAAVRDGFNVGERGFVSYEQAIERLRRYAEDQQRRAQITLDAIKHGDVRVFQYRGIHALRDMRELTPPDVQVPPAMADE